MSNAKLLRSLPSDFRIVLADVGSAGGLHQRWKPWRAILSVLMFEPREGGAVTSHGPDKIFPIALGSAAGQAKLNLLALPNMSSVLEPNTELLNTFYKKSKDGQVTGTLTIPVDALDGLTTGERIEVDAIKIDTQGSEVDIVKGAGDTLARSVLFAELEVSFLPRYRNQALAHQVIADMASRGFELLDLQRFKRYRARNAAGIRNLSLGLGQRAGRLAYGDALFMRSDLAARIAQMSRADAQSTTLKAIILCLVYGKADLASALFDTFRSNIDDHIATAIENHLHALNRKWRLGRFLHKLADTVARRV
jgi:FkbM family methyltransferase